MYQKRHYTVPCLGTRVLNWSVDGVQIIVCKIIDSIVVVVVVDILYAINCLYNYRRCGASTKTLSG